VLVSHEDTGLDGGAGVIEGEGAGGDLIDLAGVSQRGLDAGGVGGAGVLHGGHQDVHGVIGQGVEVVGGLAVFGLIALDEAEGHVAGGQFGGVVVDEHHVVVGGEVRAVGDGGLGVVHAVSAQQDAVKAHAAGLGDQIGAH